MTQPTGNSGIQISGGVVSGQVVNQSTGTFTQNVGAAPVPAEVLARLDELTKLLDQHQVALPEHAAAKRDVTDVRDEVGRGESGDKSRITDALTRLAKRVGSVTVLMTALRALGHALGVPL